MKILDTRTIITFVYFLVLFQSQLTAQVEYEMLVSSRNTNSIKRYNAQTGAYVDDFIPANSGGLSTPQDVIKKQDGNILVSGRGNTNILLYDKVSGSFIGNFTTGYSLNNPTKISFGPDGNLYVSQWGGSGQHIARFNGMTGVFINEITQSLNLPLGHTWDTAENLYVACYGSGDVRKFDNAGNYMGIFSEPGHLQGPTNLWFDGSGNLFVIDWNLGSVQKFNSTTGAFIGTFITGLINAEGYSFGPDSNLYICDWTRNQVRKYSPSGVFISIFADQGNMRAPNSILFRPVNTMSVGEENGLTDKDFTLEQNYPNPFNPQTEIKFSILKTGIVKLKIYNIAGDEISVLVNGNMKPGNYNVKWNAANFPSGIYFYEIESGNFREVKKMVLQK